QLNEIRAELARVQRILNASGEGSVSGSPRTAETRFGDVASIMPAARSMNRTVEVKPVDLKGFHAEDAEDFYRKGYALYWDGRVGEALAQFRAAVTLLDEDARFWAYKALAEKALGDLDAAQASARKAAQHQQKGFPGGDAFGLALERVQGPDRRFLNAARE